VPGTTGHDAFRQSALTGPSHRPCALDGSERSLLCISLGREPTRMKAATALLVLGLLSGCGRQGPVPQPPPLEEPTARLTTAKSAQERFYLLNAAAKQSLVAGNVSDAEKFARELIALAPQFKGDWNYGNAIHDANLVLGRIALKSGHIDEANRLLLEAGRSPGSPQMNSFGPNMSLAKDLLEKGERDTVVEYFNLCRKFWKMDTGRLDQWSQQVIAGKIPDFGANLVY